MTKESGTLKETPEEERLGTHNRLLGVLTNVSEELDVPLYYEHDQLFNVVKCCVPKSVAVKSAILNAGYKVSGSHCNPRALKTDAPTHFLWDMCRYAGKNWGPRSKAWGSSNSTNAGFYVRPESEQKADDSGQ
ncbi:hypothetical protein TELCIR_04596 [Teladorsagia circumcincta]|uniref:tRNA (guanine(26)-N(2))-dimethyltransferase n=1 Tax=Teladorsagia circumcincta TaxID=45464 RepID=A0A2G9UT55_TELCI|nr:hypothetical protein TELCIR_04596 [Teladorsagia circumcincta]